MAAAVDRYDGFRAELAARGLAAAAAATPTSRSTAAGRRWPTLLDARAGHSTACSSANDLMALGALQAAAERGRRVPDDVAVSASTTSRWPRRAPRR